MFVAPFLHWSWFLVSTQDLSPHSQDNLFNSTILFNYIYIYIKTYIFHPWSDLLSLSPTSFFNLFPSPGNLFVLYIYMPWSWVSYLVGYSQNILLQVLIISVITLRSWDILISLCVCVCIYIYIYIHKYIKQQVRLKLSETDTVYRYSIANFPSKGEKDCDGSFWGNLLSNKGLSKR